MKRLSLRSLFAALAFAVGGWAPIRAGPGLQIGYITDLSGPLADSYTPTWEGFELYVKALNDRGGIDGRKVKVSSTTTASTPIARWPPPRSRSSATTCSAFSG